MQRYFVSKEQFQGRKAIILGDDAHHIQRVMRLRPGDRVMVSDGAGRDCLAEIVAADSGAVTVQIVREQEANGEPAVEVWIAQSLPKGDKMETVIQKCTEVGASRFLPFASARTVVQYDGKKEAKRLERWAKIAKEAAEQAHRSRIPDIDAPRSWDQLLALVPQAGAAFICYEQEQRLGLRQALRQYREAAAEPAGPILLIIGPEGGFDPAEVEACTAAGAKGISLGRRILRTETAAVAGLSCILYEYGEI
jgi:16S rRNA (uracil1498-N3)-methyltransferase